MGVLFIFVDGLGYAPPSAANPVAPGMAEAAPLPRMEEGVRAPGTEPRPPARRAESDRPPPSGNDGALARIEALAGHPLTGPEQAPGLLHASPDGAAALALLDANLATPGLPQSGTGQAALFGGFNGAEMEGRHVPAFPTTAIRARLAEGNIFLDSLARGATPVFLNAFRDAFFSGPRPRHARLSCSIAAYATTGLSFRTLDDLRAGRAVAFDITGDALPQAEPPVPRRTPEEAGEVAARAALATDGVTMFEYFLTDRAGHLRDPAFAREVLERVDRFAAAAWAVLGPAGGRLLLTSDHGNVEDLATKTHTRNPVPAVALGPGAAGALRGCRSILDVREMLAFWGPGPTRRPGRRGRRRR